jgi:ubiquinone/menaquinone biosynthesis C-methylase UbiE
MDNNRARAIRNKQSQIFDRQYGLYREYHLPNWRLSYLQRMFQALEIEESTISPTDAFLDIGVGGSGYTVIEAARMGFRAVGVDLSAAGVAKAATFAQETLGPDKGGRCAFVVASAEALPFKDGSFSKVASIAVMEHVPDDKRAFDELSRVVRAGGRALVCVPNTYRRAPFLYRLMGVINDRRVGHLRQYHAEEMMTEFGRRGFEMESLLYHAHLIKILQWILGIIYPPLLRRNSALWWKLERMDLAQKDDSRAATFSLVMIKGAAN